MAKSSKSKDEDKKRKSSDQFRMSNGDIRVTKDWLQGDIASGDTFKGPVKATAKGVHAATKSTGDASKGSSGSAKSTDGRVQSGPITVRSADGSVVYSKTKHQQTDISALLRAASTIEGEIAERFRKNLSVYSEGRAFKGMDIAEIQKRVERMEIYHSKTKALFSSFLNECGESVFSGALAGNTRKNKLKKKNGTSSGD